MRNGSTDLLVVLGGNPIFDAPADLGLPEALRSVPLRIHLSLDDNETSDLCDWHVNEAHFLESWSDAMAAEGTIGIVQPLIAPLYAGKTSHELIAALADQAGISGYELVRNHWKQVHRASDFESWWRKALHDGVASPPEDFLSAHGTIGSVAPDATAASGSMELVFLPDPTIFDGRFANNVGSGSCRSRSRSSRGTTRRR
jgi:molybdopterin-containing oxidoreductase family iron-sulfur binding subunit